MLTTLNSIDSYALLSQHVSSMLIDVRTDIEWNNMGIPDINNIFLLSWRIYPDMSINKHFQTKLLSKIQDKNMSLLFICRLGQRSFEAASCAINMGYTKCYNISDGFEGNVMGFGWKNNNLPWK